MKDVLDVLIDIASTPAILVAFIAVVGLLLQKKGIADIIRGGIKTFVGFLIVTAGANFVVSSLEPFGIMFQKAFHVTGVVPNNEAIVAVALEKFGTYTALIMLAGMLFNILFARITRYKYIYLTGHATLYMACMIAVILSVSGLDGFLLVLFGGISLGIANTVFPAILQPFTVQVTKNDSVALAHTGNFGYAFSAIIGKYFGNKEKSTEDINFPKGLAFLRDSTVSITLTMGVVYMIVAIFTGNAYVTEKLSGGTNYIVYALQQAGSFAAGVFIILAGVRLILAEIVPAFKGISEKLVPNSIPALDCPIVFPYAPNAVILGFLGAFIGALFWLVVLGKTAGYVFVPTMIVLFFHAGTAGVFGNSTGGIRGAVIAGFITATIVAIGQYLMVTFLITHTIPDTAMWAADSDMFILGVIFKFIAQIIG